MFFYFSNTMNIVARISYYCFCCLYSEREAASDSPNNRLFEDMDITYSSLRE